MTIEIKSWIDDKVLYTAENAQDVRQALEQAVAQYAKLQYAKLQGAELQGAELQGAELQYAKLQYAKLQGAKLQGAKLQGAELQYAELQGAELQGAKLQGAELQGADDPRSPLFPIRLDFWSVLDTAPAEVGGLRTALVEGRINGIVYHGECACLVGTIANVRGVGNVNELAGVPKDANRPAELWFAPIREGDTPVDAPSAEKSEGVFRASFALRWLDEWVASRTAIAAALSPAGAS